MNTSGGCLPSLTLVVRHHEYLPKLSRFSKPAPFALHDSTDTVSLWQMWRTLAAPAQAQYHCCTRDSCGWHLVRARVFGPRRAQDACLFSGTVCIPCWRHHVAVHAATAGSEMMTRPNKADAPNAAMTSRFHCEHTWRGVGDLRR